MIDRFIVNGFLTRGAGHAIQPSITRGHAKLTPGSGGGVVRRAQTGRLPLRGEENRRRNLIYPKLISHLASTRPAAKVVFFNVYSLIVRISRLCQTFVTLHSVYLLSCRKKKKQLRRKRSTSAASVLHHARLTEKQNKHCRQFEAFWRGRAHDDGVFCSLSKLVTSSFAMV